MKLGILYATKSGTTEKCAYLLKELLPNTEVIEINNQEIFLQNYDFIIFGAPIRYGFIHKAVKSFLNQNKECLMNKKVGYFLCGTFKNQIDEVIKNNINKQLYRNARLISCFGGEINFEKLSGFEKIIIRIIKKIRGFSYPTIDKDAIKVFAESVKLLLESNSKK